MAQAYEKSLELEAEPDTYTRRVEKKEEVLAHPKTLAVRAVDKSYWTDVDRKLEEVEPMAHQYMNL